MKRRTSTVSMRCLVSFVLGMCALVWPQGSIAGEADWKCRVTGLFSAEREADLREILKQVPDYLLVSSNVQTGEATFRFDADTLYKGTKPDKVLERLDDTIGRLTNHTMGIKPLSQVPPDKLTRFELEIGVLDCKACALAAHEIAMKVEGVVQAVIDSKSGRVSVLFDPEKTNRDAVVAAYKKREVTVK